MVLTHKLFTDVDNVGRHVVFTHVHKGFVWELNSLKDKHNLLLESKTQFVNVTPGIKVKFLTKAFQFLFYLLLLPRYFTNI